MLLSNKIEVPQSAHETESASVALGLF